MSGTIDLHGGHLQSTIGGVADCLPGDLSQYNKQCENRLSSTNEWRCESARYSNRKNQQELL